MTALQRSAAFIFVLITGGVVPSEGTTWPETKSFYIRHYSGKCIEYSSARSAFVYVEICREKFRWSSGARLVHVPTGKCITVASTADNSPLKLASQCGDAKTLFRYNETNRALVHFISGKCLHPDTGDTNPSQNSTVIIKEGCNKATNKYYFRPNAYYLIRHFAGLCWSYSDADNAIQLQRDPNCDRFHYENDYKLKHVKTGKCILPGSGYILQLTSDCSGIESHLKPTPYSNIGNPLSACVHPLVYYAPTVGMNLVLWPGGCNDVNGIRFYFFDDTDIIKVKLESRNCVNGACHDPQGVLVVNGFKRRNDWQGIICYVYDHRSGLREDVRWHNVGYSQKANDELVSRLSQVKSGKIIFLVSRGKVNLTASSADVLQHYGVTAGFATTALGESYASMVTIAYTGKERRSWETSLYSIAGDGLVAEVNIRTFLDLDGKSDCSQELGIRTGKLPNSRFTASSVWGGKDAYMAFRGRLHDRFNESGWCSAKGAPISHYIQIDLGVPKIVSGLAIQGHYNGQHYLTNYSIEYSRDGIDWLSYKKLGGNDRKIFPGLYGVGMGTTRVNWLEVGIVTRYVRIVPSGRNSNWSCVRFDLFGCAATAIFEATSFENLTLKPREEIKKQLAVYAIVPGPSTPKIGVSTGAGNAGLGQNIDQFHIYELKGKAIKEGKEEGEATKTMQSNEVKIASAGTLTFDISTEGYYKFDANISLQVVDSKQESGNISIIISFESSDGMIVTSRSSNFQRFSKDRSYAELSSSNLTNELLFEGATTQFKVSLSQTNKGENKSYSNTYSVEVFVYYDRSFLELVSVDSVFHRYWSIAPSMNETQPGLVYLRTNLLSFHNTQMVLIKLKMKGVQKKLKGTKGDGSIIIDMRYKSNMLKFQGTSEKSTSKILRYKFQISDSNKGDGVSLPQSIPKFTMVYDDLNRFFFFCFQRKQYTTRNSPNCYWQREGSLVWGAVSDIVGILGIDVSSKIIYGIHRVDDVHLRAAFPYNTSYQIENSMWDSIASKPSARLSIQVNNYSSMPSSVTQQLTISKAATDLWAVTRFGIMKKDGKVWKKVVQF